MRDLGHVVLQMSIGSWTSQALRGRDSHKEIDVYLGAPIWGCYIVLYAAGSLPKGGVEPMQTS